MRARLSVGVLAAGFTVSAILLCLTISFIIALALPASPPARVTAGEVHAALTGETVPGWRRRLVPAAPFEAARQGQALVAQAGLAALLDVPSGDVRVRSLTHEHLSAEGTGALARAPSEGMQTFLAGMALAPGMSFAPVEAAVRQADGRWMVTTPPRPWLTPQRLRLSLAFVIAAALLLPAALWGSGRLTAPFRRLAEAANGDAPAAAFVGGPREAVEAALALDAMRERLGETVKERTAIMAAVAHDLRTPLTGLRLRVEGLPEIGRSAAVADIARMERLIAQLLTFVRGEAAPRTPEPLDLTDLLRECVERQTDLGRSVTLTTEGEHLIFGDRDELDRALGNLIDNAVFYGGRARVGLVSEGAQIVCLIDDDGPGLPPDQLEAVFSPFHRLEGSRNRATGGAGLGLAISRSIVARNGGEVALTNRLEGGARAIVRWPRLGAGPATAAES